MLTFSQFLFSVQGRISRSQFWLRWVLPVLAITVILIIILVAAAVSRNGETAAVLSIILGIFFLVTLWPNVAVLVKRIHDRNKSGLLALLYYVPSILYYIVGLAAGQHSPAVVILSLIAAAIGIWFFVEFGCMHGTVGANEYGADPIVGV
jgi:uncharacterized membrane protein YhaH (DUF805 family)